MKKLLAVVALVSLTGCAVYPYEPTVVHSPYVYSAPRPYYAPVYRPYYSHDYSYRYSNRYRNRHRYYR
jgi:hypothetical protein